MKLAVMMAMALATFAVADAASARHRHQVGAGKASLSQPKKAVRLPGPTTKGIIMRDGGICDPIRHMGC
jgi:hypothetical protein